MKDKKIKGIIDQTEINLKSISESIVDDILNAEEAEVEKEVLSSNHVEFGTYSDVYEESVVELEPEDKPFDMIEQLAQNISSELIDELAGELFDEIEVESQMQEEILEAVEDQIKNPESLTISEEVVDQMEDGAMKSYLSTMERMKPVEQLEEKTDLLGGADDAVTKSQLNQATSQMMSKIQTALASLGGGGLGEKDVAKMISIELGQLDSNTGSIISNLTTDDVAEGSNLYYTEERILSLVDSDYVTDRVIVNTSLRFRGDLVVDINTAPVSPTDGDMYINDSDAVAGSSWTGIAGETILQAQTVAWSEDNSRWYAMGGIIDVDEKTIVQKATPIGSMMMWMGTVNPDGWFILDGSSFSTTQNPLLDAHLSANFPGYSSGTLPDYRGHFPGGHGAGGMSSNMGGKTTAKTGDPGLSATTTVNIGGGTVTTSDAGNHRHRIGKTGDVSGSSSGGRMYHDPDNGPAQTGYEGVHNHELDLSNISGTASTSLTGWDAQTMPNAFAINFIIKHD